MWGTVTMLTILAGVDLIRLGVTLLLVSRPRPIATLFAYWVGCLVASVPAVLAPLIVLYYVPMFRPFTENLAAVVRTAMTGTTGRHVQVVLGVLGVAMAAVLAVRHAARQREQLAMAGGPTTTLTPQPSNTGHPFFALLNRAMDPARQDASLRSRLLRRTHDAWEDGSSWVGFVIGWVSGPPPLEYVFLIPAIVASGAALSTQLAAAFVFVAGMLAVVEFVLVSYLAAPARTETLVLRLQGWVQARRQWIFVTISGLMGAWMVVGNI